MDIFADALAEDVRFCEDENIAKSRAPSQDIHVGTHPIGSCIVVDDDMDVTNYAEHSIAHLAPSQELPPQDDPPTTPQPRSVSRQPSKSSASKGQKRKVVDPASIVDLKQVDMNVGNLTCIFVKKAKTTNPVPLWPQYMVNWRKLDFKCQQFIVLGTQERWMKDLVDQVTTKRVREVLKGLAATFRQEFMACMETVRKPVLLDNPFADDSDDESVAAKKKADLTEAVVDVKIGGCTVSCLNNTVRAVLKVDDATVAFINSWVLPLIREVARSQAFSGSATESRPSSGSLADFHFQADPTPNIRGKVTWNPSTSSWKVSVKKPQGKLTDKFVVNFNLPSDAYEREKVAAYWRAVQAWNRVDGSTRFRIPITRVPTQRLPSIFWD